MLTLQKKKRIWQISKFELKFFQSKSNSSLLKIRSLINDISTGCSGVTAQQIELACRQWQAPLCLMSLPISRQTAISYWLLPIIAHQNNTTLLGTKIKAAVHVCATQMSIKTPLHTDTCDLKETVKNVMNLSRQMRRLHAAVQYRNALEIWITTDTTGRSYEVWFHLSLQSDLFYFVF